MAEVWFGESPDTNEDWNSVLGDVDLSARGTGLNRVVLHAKSNAYPHTSSWMLPDQARKLARMLNAAAEWAEAANEKAEKEERDYQEYMTHKDDYLEPPF